MASTVVTKSFGSPFIFYGWWMVVVSCIAMAAGPILITGTFGIFIKPLGETFGWSCLFPSRPHGLLLRAGGGDFR